MDNIIEDLREYFNNIEEYKNIIIKEAYSNNPKNSFPMITVEETNNSEVTRYSTSQGEQVSDLGYRLEIYSQDTETMQAPKSVRKIIEHINNVLGGEIYKLRRVGSPIITAFNQTTTRGILTYDCYFELKTNIIYKK